MARFEIATCAISGAVGTFANVAPEVEAYVAEKMGLVVEPISTQVIPRDRHAAYFATLGVVASSIERLAVEIRHLQRTEVREAEEYFSAGQKRSSGSTSVTTGSSQSPRDERPAITSCAMPACSAEWVKIAERYCEPTSFPCRSRVVGSCMVKNTSSRSR